MIKCKKVFAILGLAATIAVTSNTTVYAQQAGNQQPAQEQAAQEQAAQQQAAQEQAAQQQAAQEQAAQQQAAQEQAAQQQAAQEQAAQQQAAQQQATQQTQEQATQQTQEQAAQQNQQTTNNTQTTTRRSSRTSNNNNNNNNNQQAEEETHEETKEGKYVLAFIKNANLRQTPSTSGESLVVVPRGLKLEAVAKTTNEAGEVWYKLTYAGAEGYVREDLVTAEEIETAPEEINEEETVENPEEIAEENTEGEQGQQEETTPVAVAASETKESTKTDEITSKDNSGEEEVYVNSGYTELLESESETKHQRKLDGFMLLFIAGATLCLCCTIYIYYRFKAEYARARKTMLIKNLNKDFNVTVQENNAKTVQRSLVRRRVKTNGAFGKREQ
jgi:hypothetical protein